MVSLSYLKLLGWGPNRLLMALCGLPEVLVFDSHLHDYIFCQESHAQLPAKLKLAWGIRRGHGLDYAARFLDILAAGLPLRDHERALPALRGGAGMRIVVVTQDAPLYLPEFLDRYLTALGPDRAWVRGVVVQSPHHGRTPWREARVRLAFYGPRDFLRLLWRVLAAKAGAAGAALWPRLAGGRCLSTANVLKKHGLARLPLVSVNHPDFVAFLREEKIELVVSAAGMEIVREPALSAPPKGWLNYHSALLPRHRGRQPLFWALLAGEPEVGVTVHLMDAGLDTDPSWPSNVLARRQLTSLRKTSRWGRPSWPADPGLLTGIPPAWPTTPPATRQGFPGREDGRRFGPRAEVL